MDHWNAESTFRAPTTPSGKNGKKVSKGKKKKSNKGLTLTYRPSIETVKSLHSPSELQNKDIGHLGQTLNY